MRLLSISVVSVGPACVATLLLSFGACAPITAPTISTTNDDATVPPLDGGIVGAPASDAGATSDAPSLAPSCDAYCALVDAHCTGEHAPYASNEECLAFCRALPEGPTSELDTDTIGCRLYYAGTPALTDPARYCAAAGPFGGGTCGDRCVVFCELVATLCGGDGGRNPYLSIPACVTTCATLGYRDAATDGGGDGPLGAHASDTLNCRLDELRAAVRDPKHCANLGTTSPVCH